MGLVVGGVYQHYKGNLYKAIGIAKHSETLEEVIVYQALYGNGALWVRPINMFFDKVIVDGEEKERFRYISDEMATGNG